MEIFYIFLYIFFFCVLYVQVFLLTTFLENKKKFLNNFHKNKETAKENLPSVAIIVPCFNEEHSLAGTIHSLLSLSYPSNLLEIIIVNDGSTDKTLSVARSLEQNKRVSVITQTNGGKHSALNVGIKITDADVIGCLDADSFVDKNALIRMVADFKKPNVMAITPAIKVYKPNNTIELIQKVEYEIGVFLRKMFGLLNAQYVTPGPFSLYKKEVFEKLGGFVQGYDTEDMEMALRIRANHFRIENINTAFVYTIAPKTMRALYYQRLRWVSGFLNNILHNYRYLLFNTKYGHLGLFSLPGALFAIVGVLYVAVYMITSISTFLFDKYLTMINVNFEILWQAPAFTWFFINTQPLSLLATIMFAFMFAILLIGRHLSFERLLSLRDIASFFIFYGIIAPTWISMSVYNVARGKNVKWK